MISPTDKSSVIANNETLLALKSARSVFILSKMRRAVRRGAL